MDATNTSSGFNINTGIQVSIPRETIYSLLFLGVALILIFFLVKKFLG